MGERYEEAQEEKEVVFKSLLLPHIQASEMRNFEIICRLPRDFLGGWGKKKEQLPP